MAPLPPVPPTEKAIGDGASSRGWRRSAVAAAVVLCLFAGVCLTETIGVTKLRATLSRLFTPEDTSIADPDRRAAEWVLSIGGGISIKENDKERQFGTIQELSGRVRHFGAVGDLPRGPFELMLVSLAHNPKVTDAGLANFKNCKNLTQLFLANARLSDAGLANFKDCKDLVYLSLPGTALSDAGLAHFKGCRYLAYLHLAATDVSDAGLAYFKDCNLLSTLVLSNTRVGDAGLAHFQDCNKLAVLHLSDTELSDAGLAHFKNCTNLTLLDLAGTKVSDAGLAYFMDCKHLTQLYLGDTKVSDEGLANFKGCKRLGVLHLGDTSVGDVGLTHFRDCKNLTQLYLTGTEVSDGGLAHFKDCKKLIHLTLQKTNVTAAGIDELKEALPKCTIEWVSGVVEPTPAKRETQAFVILSSKGVQLGKFDTLADAVVSASDGDTIEVAAMGRLSAMPSISRSASDPGWWLPAGIRQS